MYTAWVLALGAPLWVLAACLVARPERFVWPQLLQPLLWALAFPLAGIVWLARYRLVFDDDSLRYRSWSLREQTIPYDQIISVELSKATPLSRAPISTHVHLMDGGYIVIYTKAFSRTAIKRLYALGSRGGPNKSFKPNPLRGSA
jgi:hypothetical protein